jgi:hypothetical protein
MTLRRLVARVLHTYDRAGAHLRSFAAGPYVPAVDEPEPTVPSYLQHRLAARDAQAERDAQLWDRLLTTHAELGRRQQDLDDRIRTAAAEWSDYCTQQGLN